MVRAGRRDSVASLARRYRVSAASVADWNDVRANAAFKAGEQVVLYLPVRLARALAAGAEAAAPRRGSVQVQSRKTSAARAAPARSPRSVRTAAPSASKPVRSSAKKAAKR